MTWKTFVHTPTGVDIDWDAKKAEANLREHGVAFAKAATVPTDDYALTRSRGKTLTPLTNSASSRSG